ncbi:MAG TPA: FeoA domain-containing protein [Thermoanaerobaculia bacterium]|jgi:Fe2+ transport system protein FeoA
MDVSSPRPVRRHGEPVELTSLAVGDRARLHGASLERTDREILEALGLTGACRLRVCQAGDPWIVQVRATRIGIADPVARAIRVVPEDER